MDNIGFCDLIYRNAGMAELADAQDLGNATSVEKFNTLIFTVKSC